MRTRISEHTATIVVAALGTLFASTLILLTGIMTAVLSVGVPAESGTFRTMLLTVSIIFIVIALYVGAIVTANTFATVIAGRTREIALLRLLGSTSARVRSQVALEGLAMGAIGAVSGVGLAIALTAGLVAIGTSAGWLDAGLTYPLFDPLIVVAALIVIATTWLAAWTGSQRVAGVSPIEATRAAVELRPEEARGRSGRTVWAITLIIFGAAALALGVALSFATPLAIMVSFVGGLVSFTGIALGAHFIMPPILRLAGRVTGKGVTGQIAAANAVRFPERSARSTIGLVIGITLVVMFAVALATYTAGVKEMFDQDPSAEAMLDQTLTITSAVLTLLVGFSGVIAAVGLVNTLSLSVVQRIRELGLLRAIGFTGSQVRRMIMAESTQMTLAAFCTGVVLGVFYGWVAAQSMVGSQVGLVIPVVPWALIVGVAVFGVALACIAAAGPARRATKVSPVLALAVD